MNLNKKGQAALIFIILIPVFIFVAAIVVDTGINMYNEKKHKNVTEEVMESLLEYEGLEDVDYTNKNQVTEELEKKAKLIYENNEIETEYLRVEILYGSRIRITNSHVYYSFMNSLFNKGQGKRQITIDAEGYKENDIVTITFEGDSNED